MASQTKSIKKGPSALVKGYLFLYNSIETIGWTVILVQLVSHYLSTDEYDNSLYRKVKWPLIVFQNAAILEIIHAATGIVPSNPIVTTQQVFSRVIVVCGVIIPTISAQNTLGLPLALLAWSVTEIIRYAYYALNLINAVPYFLVWLRYTTFIVLYPIGVTGELLCLYAAQQEVGRTGLWSLELPNSINFSFSYQYFLILIMLLYIPFFPQLYLHMFTQRKKVLGSTSSSNSSSSTSKDAGKKIK